MTVLAGGRHAVTHAAVVARFAHVDLLRVELDTGRTTRSGYTSPTSATPSWATGNTRSAAAAE